MSDQTTAVMTALAADKLLTGSYILAQINELKDNLRYRSDGRFIAFDDVWLDLEKQVDGVPRLELQNSVATGTENQYIITLVQKLETALDDTDRVGQKIIHFEAKLKDASDKIKTLRGAFTVWYTLAAMEVLTTRYNGISIPSSQLAKCAESEFSRLMDGTVQTVASLLSAVKATFERLKLHKKTQQEKFDLGKDQANASWTSGIPAFGSSIGELPLPTAEEEVQEPEETVDEAPIFVRQEVKVGTSASWKDHKGDTVIARQVAVADDSPKPDVDEPKKPGVTVYEKALDGGVQTTDGTPVVRGGADGFPIISLAPVVSGLVVHHGDIPPSITVAVIPDGQYEQLRSAVQDGPVSADDFAAALSDEPLAQQQIKKAEKAVKDKAAAQQRRKVDPLMFAEPAGGFSVDRDQDPAEKIKCVVCDRRIRKGQQMFKRDGGWAHAVHADCEREQRADARTPGAVMTQLADTTHTVIRDSEDAAPSTKPLEPELPKQEDFAEVVGTGDTLLAQMENGAANTKLKLTDEARKVTPTPEEKEEQRFAAANVAVPESPKRKIISFLEDDGEVI